MPPTVTSPVPQAPATPSQQSSPLAIVPFTRASFEHIEPAAIDRSNVIGAASLLLGPDDIPAYGFLRSLLIYVQATGGTGAAATYKADAPWSALQEITVHDVNGAPIFGPLGGYDLFVIYKWGGGFAAWQDPTVSPAFVTQTAAGNFSFMLRIPIEISARDGLGALPNQNSSATYKIRVVQADQTQIYAVNPTTPATLRYRVWAECWAAPSATSPAGAPQAVQPPAVGTTQLWSKAIYTVNNGFNTIPFRRVGSPIRNLLLIFRDTTPARADATMADPIQIYLDSKLLINEAQVIRQHYMRERSFNNAARDVGVYLYDFTHDLDGGLGWEMRDLWLPTVQSTRLELQGTFTAAGTLTVLTNDVAVVGNPYLD